jgi:N-acetylglucosaminyldiphosphoundecaprenol N-acetyl-beta-D-mannosaminyltransferase
MGEMPGRECEAMSEVAGNRLQLIESGAAPRADILGVPISAINMNSAVDTIAGWISECQRHYVCVCNVHTVMECKRSESIRRIYHRAGLVTPDGMPLVWVTRLMGFQGVERVYGPDLMLAVMERSTQRGWSHFLYGGAPGVAERLSSRMTAAFPGIKIAGEISPPFRPLTPLEDADMIKRINDSGADIVWAGIGAPRQERWMADHREPLSAPVLIGVGAAFDFLAGVKAQAPRWMMRSGLEWIFRFACEPRRLWRRYLLNNPLFMWFVLLQFLGLEPNLSITSGSDSNFR